MGRAARALTPILAGLVSVQAVRSSADFAVQIGRLSQVANASTTEFQKFAQAARTVGVEQDKVADILKDVNDRVGDFLATGGGPMKDFFENVAPLVGVTADQFRNLSGPQAYSYTWTRCKRQVQVSRILLSILKLWRQIRRRCYLC